MGDSDIEFDYFSVPTTSNPSLYDCKFCVHKSFKTMESLRKHEQNWHKNEDLKWLSYANIENVQCTACDKKFNFMSILKEHIHRNHAQRSCPLCGVKVKNIKWHQKYHHSERKLPCKSCDKEFVLKKDLKRHENGVHLKLKPHLCSHCGRGFADSSNRNAHESSVHAQSDKI